MDEGKEVVYEFVYCECIYESGSVTISIHKSKKGAETALTHHKEKEKQEHDEMYKDEPDMLCDMPYDQMKHWSVVETEVLP